VDGSATGKYPRTAESGSEVGPYRLLRRLGKGGMAEVFLAVHRHLGHVRAVKVLWPEESEARAALAKRLLTEARATARLRHPAIVEVFECDTLPGGGAFIAMEYLQGEPGGTWLERTGALATHPLLAAALLGVVADALGHAHGQGIVHRDVKPDNLVLIPDESDRLKFRVKMLDFGIAKMLNEQPLVVTRADRAIGTPYYMAPEQWFGGGIIDARTDIYSLGCVFFEVLTGRPPFDREDGMAMMHAHLEEQAPDPRSVAPETPEPLATLVAQMLAKSPDDRPQSMIEVVTALERYLERYRHAFEELLRAPEAFPVAIGVDRHSEPTSLGVGTGSDPGRPSQTTAPVTADSKRRRRRIAAVAALAVVGVAAFFAAGALFSRPRTEAVKVAAPVAAQAPPPPPAPAPPPPAPAAVAPPVEEPAVRAVVVPPPRPAPAERRPAARPQRPRNVYRPVGD
jgi:serine/threonine protein kinase